MAQDHRVVLAHSVSRLGDGELVTAAIPPATIAPSGNDHCLAPWATLVVNALVPGHAGR